MPMIELRAASLTAHMQDRAKVATALLTSKLGRKPTLATVLVGDDAASKLYVSKKGASLVAAGMGHIDHPCSPKTSMRELLELLRQLNNDPAVDGILVQSPLPAPLVEREVFDAIDPRKDVDCFSPTNVGLLSQNRGILLPCTPMGIIKMLEWYKIPIAGKAALVIGRSDIVGKPISYLLLQRNATVTVAHSKTGNMRELVASSDIIVVAVGKKHFIDSTYAVKNTATIVDVGINRGADGKVVGDVDYASFSGKVFAMTPVPGGVGPMTIACLIENTLLACAARENLTPVVQGALR